MNAVTELLSRVRQHGAELVPTPADYRVRIHPPTEIPGELMAELRRHKPELLAYLRTCSYYRYRLRGGAGMNLHRNLSPNHFRLLLGRKYNRVKAQGSRTDLTSPQNEDKLPTAEKLAKEHGVGRATVERAGAVAEAIDNDAIPELREKVERDEVSVSAAADVATLPKEEQREVVEEINTGGKPAEVVKAHVANNSEAVVANAS